VAGNAEGGKEEKRVETSTGSEVALAENVSTLAHTVYTLSVDQFVVLECHIAYERSQN
jgi:hypothetical protein